MIKVLDMRKFSFYTLFPLGLLILISSASAFVIVSPIPIIGTTGVLSTGTINQPYSQTLQVSGGTAPFTWTITAGSLPSGLALGSSTGTVSGTPTSTGLFNFTAQVTDANLETATQGGRYQ